jgi:hypothetical protein
MEQSKSTNPTNATANNRQNGEVNLRAVPAMKIANLKRKMDGAETRVHRLENELVDVRAIIRRKYVEKEQKDSESKLHIELSPAQIEGFRLQRTIIEGRLAEARGELRDVVVEYREAVRQNLLRNRKLNSETRTRNKTVREAGKLKRKTIEILKQHGANGGAKDVAELKALAETGDIKNFRRVFDEKVKDWAPEHYITISGVSMVKTEIVHELMEQLTSEPVSTGTITDLNV